MLSESSWNYRFATSVVDGSLTEAAPFCSPAARPATASGGLEPISESVLWGSNSLHHWARVLSFSLIRSLLLFDAGHVSAAPKLIYHSNCDWRMGVVEEQRKAAQTLPSLTLYLVICAKAVPSIENGDLVFWTARWAKNNTTHTTMTPRWGNLEGYEDVLIHVSILCKND